MNFFRRSIESLEDRLSHQVEAVDLVELNTISTCRVLDYETLATSIWPI